MSFGSPSWRRFWLKEPSDISPSWRRYRLGEPSDIAPLEKLICPSLGVYRYERCRDNLTE
jgi:hypothetical protein